MLWTEMLTDMFFLQTCDLLLWLTIDTKALHMLSYEDDKVGRCVSGVDKSNSGNLRCKKKQSTSSETLLTIPYAIKKLYTSLPTSETCINTHAKASSFQTRRESRKVASKHTTIILIFRVSKYKFKIPLVFNISNCTNIWKRKLIILSI